MTKQREDFKQKIRDFINQEDAWTDEELELMLEDGLDNLFDTQCCQSERPARKVFCQLPRGHKGSHSAVVYWEDD